MFVYLGSVLLVVGAVRSSRLLHNELLHSCLRAPMMFFDKTPVGRILNRFSGDVDVMDSNMHVILDDWLSCMLDALGTLIVIAVSTPWFLGAIVPLAVFFHFVQVTLGAARCVVVLEVGFDVACFLLLSRRNDSCWCSHVPCVAIGSLHEPLGAGLSRRGVYMSPTNCV